MNQFDPGYLAVGQSTVGSPTSRSGASSAPSRSGEVEDEKAVMLNMDSLRDGSANSSNLTYER